MQSHQISPNACLWITGSNSRSTRVSANHCFLNLFKSSRSRSRNIHLTCCRAGTLPWWSAVPWIKASFVILTRTEPRVCLSGWFRALPWLQSETRVCGRKRTDLMHRVTAAGVVWVRTQMWVTLGNLRAARNMGHVFMLRLPQKLHIEKMTVIYEVKYNLSDIFMSDVSRVSLSALA